MAYEPAISLHPTIKTLRPELPSVMQVAGSETPTTSSASGGRHRPSKTPRLKRAFSSPNVGGAREGEHAQLSSMDKKRNKLGYHRTAVACGRKISYLPSLQNADSNRTLSSQEDSMHNSERRYHRPLSKLYPAQERLSILPCGSAGPLTWNKARTRFEERR